MSKILIDEATVKLALDYLDGLIRGLKMDDKSHAHQVAADLREALAEQPAPKIVDCHATGVCVQSGLRAEEPAQQEPVATCPQDIIHAITLYGDARADQDANNAPTTSHERLADCVRLVRKALAEQPAQQDSTCSNALRAQGKAYPRTCKKCGLGPCVELAQQALDKMAENAREQPAQKCSYPYCGCNSKAWCKVERNEALDKMAENARELGLDYEPAQQEPIAGQPLPCPFCGHIGLDFADGETYRWGVASCGGCGASCGDVRREYPDKGEWHTEAIAEWNKRSPAAQRTWVGLTDEEQQAAYDAWQQKDDGWGSFYALIEAKLRSKNEDRN